MLLFMNLNIIKAQKNIKIYTPQAQAMMRKLFIGKSVLFARIFSPKQIVLNKSK